MNCFKNVKLYKRSNSLQRRDARELIEEFGSAFNWRPDGEDSWLDIGCGSGDVTIDYILPVLPTNFKRLVGVDLSEQMIAHARKQYVHPKIFFEQFDAGVDVKKQSLQHLQPFDHVTSFYCLHWVQQQKQAIQNIYDLLKPNGDCLLMFIASSAVFEVHEQMSRSSKWGKYMTDVNRFLSPYLHSKDPANQLSNLFRDCNFSDYRTENRVKVFSYDDYNDFKSKLFHMLNFLKSFF